MDNNDPRIEELLEVLVDFMGSFELVFGNDWDYTLSIIRDPKYMIDDDKTFLNPLPPTHDESNNWWNRGSLLHRYRELKSIMLRLGLYTILDYNE